MLQTDTYNVEPERYAHIEKRQFYGGFAWFSKENGDFFLACKEKDVISLQDMK